MTEVTQSSEMSEPSVPAPETMRAEREPVSAGPPQPEAAAALQPLRYKGYIPGLDVLRGAAILLVLLYHGFDGRVPWRTAHGWMRWPLLAAQYGSSGVQLFYVLSGFLISSILIDTVASRDYYRKFYVRRALRILPAYLLMLAVLKVDHVIGWRFVLAALLYIANMASLVGARSSEYGALWSLAVEEQFYLIWPIFVRKLSLKALTRFIIGYMIFDVLLRLVFVFYLPHADATYKLWFNAEMLLSGALVAICLRRDLLRRENISRVMWTLAGLALVTWPVVLGMDLRGGDDPGSALVRALSTLYHFPFMLTYVALLLVVLKRNRGAVEVAQRSAVTRTLAFLGYISYGLYLVHQLVFGTYDRLVAHTRLAASANHPLMLLLGFVFCVAISILLAFLSRRYFEEIFLRQKDKIVPYKNPEVNEAPIASPV